MRLCGFDHCLALLFTHVKLAGCTVLDYHLQYMVSCCLLLFSAVEIVALADSQSWNALLQDPATYALALWFFLFLLPNLIYWHLCI